MPQLDHFSFLSQVFWVLLFFTSFYFLNLRQILPGVASILKVRRRTLQKSQSAFESVHPAKDVPLVESHIEFFSFTKIFASVLIPSEPKNTITLLQTSSVTVPLDSQLSVVIPKALALNFFTQSCRKIF